LTGQILESINTTPQEKVLQRIASLSPIRRGKVPDIRRQIADGSYKVADRLDRVMGRILEAITT
jgi:anti-sigma28 factor (negative regulator of flagellin synthesis)